MTDFNEIYQKYYPDVYKFLLSLCADEYLAQDLAADTFLKAVTGIEKFRGECALYTWLCRIAKNLYYDYLKKQKQNTLNVCVTTLVCTQLHQVHMLTSFLT